MAVTDKLDKTPPYKLLALDGGGIRGVMTLEILREIERTAAAAAGPRRLLRARRLLRLHRRHQHGRHHRDVPLSRLARRGHPRVLRRGRPGDVRSSQPAEAVPVQVRGREARRPAQGADRRRTPRSAMRSCARCSCSIMRNATTDSPWPVSNNPRAKYNDLTRANSNPVFRCGSSCVPAPRRRPTFPPETIQVGEQRFVFVDGGVTMYNNPAFQLFLMATVAPYQSVLGGGRAEDAARLDWHRHEPECQRRSRAR